ncbi:uncharacterized protein LOC119652994 isoform X2 [Hermetia illucens]|nr:uncharacterized protein LOC119652994 isoform X2 [Hermetia illucens]
MLLENMVRTRVSYLRPVILCLLIVANPDFILCLKNVSVTVPTAVKKGDNALLICNYDLEGDPLYSVKWYKGRREFYRYTPKENPAMKTFAINGINVERSLSNQSHVILSSVQPMISGKFSCEVSADAPSFHTMVVSGELDVVELPTERPTLMGIHSRYRLGDTINGNCTSNYSKPAANLTWTINDIPVMPRDIKSYEPLKFENLESSVLEINFTVQHHQFIRGRLKLKCTARIHGIYEQDIEKYIEEDRPRILASGRSPDVNLFGYDSQGDGEMTDQSDFYSTHYKDMPSSASSITRVGPDRRRETTPSVGISFSPRIVFHRMKNLLSTTLTLDSVLFVATLISILISNNFISSPHTILHYRTRCKDINHHQQHHPGRMRNDEKDVVIKTHDMANNRRRLQYGMTISGKEPCTLKQLYSHKNVADKRIVTSS